jgi:hypothetical protein
MSSETLHRPSEYIKPYGNILIGSREASMNSSDDKTDKMQPSAGNQQNLTTLNYCRTGIFSTCGTGTAWSEHSLCKFAVKSEYANKCMHYIEARDGHCDCLDAQKEAINTEDYGI